MNCEQVRERLGRFHPSRTIVCALEPRRDRLDAWATMTTHHGSSPGSLAVCEERVEIEMGQRHIDGLDTIVDPLIVHDLATVIWSPHGHDDAVDALVDLADVFLIDSVEAPDPAAAIARAEQLLQTGYVVDLAWLRSTPWRERRPQLDPNATFSTALPPVPDPEPTEIDAATRDRVAVACRAAGLTLSDRQFEMACAAAPYVIAMTGRLYRDRPYTEEPANVFLFG